MRVDYGNWSASQSRNGTVGVLFGKLQVVFEVPRFRGEQLFVERCEIVRQYLD